MLPEHWIRAALDVPLAFGGAAGRARLRVEPEDFQVDEQLGFAPAGAGPHALLRVRKRLANTEWVAREIARAARVRPFDVGYAGLKDRRAVTTQWFTVPLGKATADSWLGAQGEGWQVIEAHAHGRKLPRGALAGNRFTLRLRQFEGDRDRCLELLQRVGEAGTPNGFGPQRFGRELGNLQVAWAATQHAAGRDGEPLRGMVLSAARSLMFNAVLAQRIAQGSWNTLVAGDLANLDGRNSVFAVDQPDATLAARVAALDLHPTGPLQGEGGPQPAGDVAALEQQVLAQYGELGAVVLRSRVEAARRPLRVALRHLEAGFDGDTLQLGFELRGGSFATAVLREIVDAAEPGGEDPD
jgi:tRNA pseudouridine13 synthase